MTISYLNDENIDRVLRIVDFRDSPEVPIGAAIEYLTLAITPALATSLLRTNSDNQRNLKDGVVDSYAHQMRHNQWRNNGETIKLSRTGKLIDGQHRLTAILRSGCSITLTIAINGRDEDITTIDNGLARTNSDALKISGAVTKNHNLIASVIRNVYLVNLAVVQGKPFTNVSGTKTTGNMTHSCLLKLPNIADDINRLTQRVSQAKIRRNVPLIHAVTVWWLIKHVNPEAAEAWIQTCEAGIPCSNLDTDCPMYLLVRSHINAKISGKANDSQRYFTFLGIYHAGRYIQGKRAKLLRRPNSDQFMASALAEPLRQFLAPMDL